MYYQKNPVPWNLKKKKRGGIPINLYEGPIQCPANVPYFNVYKVECDLNNNSVAQELQNPDGPNGPDKKTPLGTRQYVVNRNYERFNSTTPLDDLKKELDQLPNYDNEEECEQTCTSKPEKVIDETPFWFEDPSILIDKDHILDIIPNQEMSSNQLLNSVVRFSIVLFFLIYLVTQEISMLYFVVAAILATMFIHKERGSDEQSDEQSDEKFIGLPSSAPGGVGTSNNPLDYKVLNTPAEFDDRLFKSNEENAGNYMMERNKVKSWDPFCPLSITGGGFEHILYGDNVKRHLFY